MKGELDWVVLKALEKDRTRRYDTANGLARDIQRYLATRWSRPGRRARPIASKRPGSGTGSPSPPAGPSPRRLW